MKKNKKVMKEYPTHHAIVNYDRNTNKVLVG